MSFLELARARYSVRSFDARPVEPNKLLLVLEAGRIAPTAHNDQPQRILVVSDPEGLKKVDECTPCRFGAPTVLVVCYDSAACWERSYDGAKSGEVDASIVTTHMMMAAIDAGLGTCWVMNFDPAKLRAGFVFPEGVVPVALLPIGYPSDAAAPSPRHAQREPLETLMLK